MNCSHHYHVAETLVDKERRIVHVLAICLKCADFQVRTADLSK